MRRKGHVRVRLHEPLFAVPELAAKVARRVGTERFRLVNVEDANLLVGAYWFVLNTG